MNCPRCARPVEAGVLDKLAGVCLQCLCGFALEADPEPAVESAAGPLPLEPGLRFEGFEVLGLLARGGMGIVYKARQPDLDRRVALKILSPELARDPEFTQRFNSEARVLARLNDPNIVQVFAFGRQSGLYYLAMEYVEGISLRDILRERRLESDEVCAILSQICLALSTAHSQGVVHRDIKPENILIDAQKRVKIADFGLAKIVGRQDGSGSATRTDVVMGTPSYMAPEQRENLPGVDHRADLYSLGVILYEMLTGVTPNGPYQPPSRMAKSDRRLDPIVLKALERSPDQRYQTALHLKTDLEAAKDGGSGRASGSHVARIAFVAALLLAVLGWGVWTATRPVGVAAAGPWMPRAWQWENKTEGSGTEGNELVFGPPSGQRMIEAVPVDSRLDKRFRLQFQLKYLMDGVQQPWLFLIFEAAPGSGHERNAVIFFPEADHTLAFASRVTGKGWGLREYRPIPEAGYGQGKWHDWEVFWDDSIKRLKVSANGVETFSSQLGVMDTLHGVWHFGLGGSCKQLRIRNVRILDVPFSGKP